MANPKGKGSSYENEIAKQLSLWFTEGERDDVFGRSDGSGSRFTSRRKKGKDTANQSGDITFTDIIGEPLIKIWSVEVKTGYSAKKKVKDADGDVVKIPIYAPAKKGEKKKDKNQREIIGWKDKKELVPWDVLDLVDSNKKETVFEMMWKQCARDAAISYRNPVLIFRRNARQSCICFRKPYYISRTHYYGKCKSNLISVTIDDRNLVIMSLKQFFDWAQPVCDFLSE